MAELENEAVKKVTKLETRIQNKLDSLDNWNNSSIELLSGEIAIVKTPEEPAYGDTAETRSTPTVAMKIGELDENGQPKSFKDLPWVSDRTAIHQGGALTKGLRLGNTAAGAIKDSTGQNTVLGIDENNNLNFGSTNYSTQIKGKYSRPKYVTPNNNEGQDLALFADITSEISSLSTVAKTGNFNDLNNLPFYNFINISWNGDTADKVQVLSSEIAGVGQLSWYKVSDKFISSDEVIGAEAMSTGIPSGVSEPFVIDNTNIIYNEGESSGSFLIYFPDITSPAIFCIEQPMTFSFCVDIVSTTITVTFDEAGIYFLLLPEQYYFSQLYKNGKVFIPVDDTPTSGSENLITSGGVYTELNKLATVATSGSYNDLSDVPEIDKTLSEASTDDNVPSSKCVYDAIRTSYIQSDYEQNDNSQPDYIKNRTHYKEIIHQEKVDLLPATEIDFSSLGDMGYSQSEPLNVQAGDVVKVLWDNQEYECKAQLGAAVDPEGNSGLPSDGIIFGNLYAVFGVDPDSQDIPFLAIANYAVSEQGFISGCVIQSISELTSPIITVNIFTGGDKVVYHKLDVNYLPISKRSISFDENNIITSKCWYANRPDWDVSDRNDPRYIQNRPFSRRLQETSRSGFISTTITLDENGLYTSKGQLYDFNNIWNNSYNSDISLTIYWHDGTYNCNLRQIYTEWTDEYGDYHSGPYFVFGNVSDIASYNDTAPFLIYADFNPETHKIGETYIKAYDGFTGELTLQVDAEYRYWSYNHLSNEYLDIRSLQANWEVEDSSAPSFICNKPFSKQKQRGENNLSQINPRLMFNNSGICITRHSYFNLNKRFEEDEPVDSNNVFAKGTWNDTEYKYKVRKLSCEYYDSNKGINITDYYYVFGNVSSIDSNYSDTAPFLVYANYNPETHQYGETYIVSQENANSEIQFEVSWIYDYWQYNTISNKYLHLSSNVSENDENPVTSGAVYNAIQSAIGNALGGSY